LSANERQTLQQIVPLGMAPARQLIHAHSLLNADCAEAGPTGLTEAQKAALTELGAVEGSVAHMQSF
jgi:hypothetical protein